MFMSGLEITNLMNSDTDISIDQKRNKITFFKLREEFYRKYALLHSTHLKSFIPKDDKSNYLFLIKKRYIVLLKLTFCGTDSLIYSKSQDFWELRGLMEELLLWKQSKKHVLSLAVQYRGHPDYLSFLTLIKQLKAERKKSLFSSFFPITNLDH